MIWRVATCARARVLIASSTLSRRCTKSSCSSKRATTLERSSFVFFLPPLAPGWASMPWDSARPPGQGGPRPSTTTF
ncbi:MAG: hypothetical protein J3K34DRAFT_414803 [Monoraphidium minutum]|nr:MAG: hypothetical protein J3K34DRAFT_414803 [Monoraphidium minutum]